MKEVPEARRPYLALNNLDELDPRGTPDPYQTEDYRFDEPPTEFSNDELYRDATKAELRELTKLAFFDGLNDYQHGLPKHVSTDELRRRGTISPGHLVVNSLRWIAAYVRTHHLLPAREVSARDRMQNGVLYALHQAGRWDPDRGTSLISMLNPRMSYKLSVPETGGLGVTSNTEIYQGELIRFKHTRGVNDLYRRIRAYHYAMNMRFDRELEAAELTQFGAFTDEEVQLYEEMTIDYDSFEHLPDPELPRDDYLEPDLAEQVTDVVADAYIERNIPVALGYLKPDQVDIVRRRFYEGATLKELSITRGVTRQAIGLVERRSLNKLLNIAKIREALSGEILLFPESTTEQSPESHVELQDETPLTEQIRDLMKGRSGILKHLQRNGVDLASIYEGAGMPYFDYAHGKIEGEVFMTEEEARRLVAAVSAWARDEGLSLNDLTPKRADQLQRVLEQL
jgi:hypothetical protein